MIVGRDAAETTPLLARLVELLPVVRERVRDPRAWRAFALADPATGAERVRLECVDRIADARYARTWSLALHAFSGVDASAMHDHRYPLVVFPFGAVGCARDAVLYEMPWASSDGRTGVAYVRHAQAWAIVDTSLRHAVVSRAPHFSVVLSDVTAPATRADRLLARQLVPDEYERARVGCVAALERAA